MFYLHNKMQFQLCVQKSFWVVHLKDSSASFNVTLRAPTEDLELFKERDFSFPVEGGKTHPKNTVLNCNYQHQISLDCPEVDMPLSCGKGKLEVAACLWHLVWCPAGIDGTGVTAALLVAWAEHDAWVLC